MEARPSPVVVAIGDRGSDTAVEYAAIEAARQQRGLHLVHAVDLAPTRAPTAEADVARLKQHGADVLERAAGVAGLLAGLPVTSELAFARPVAAVASAGERATLVVVGRRVEPRRAHAFTGSEAGGVAGHVRAPVISVPDGWRASSSPGQVVVGIDGGEDSAEVLLEALAAARAAHARLTVVSTWWRPQRTGPRSLTEVDDSARNDSIRAGIDRTLAGLLAAYDDVQVEVDVRNAPAGPALVEASRDAALVVLGRHDPILPSGSRLGPVARSVLRDAVCPVRLAAPRHAHRVHRHEGHQPQSSGRA